LEIARTTSSDFATTNGLGEKITKDSGNQKRNFETEN